MLCITGGVGAATRNGGGVFVINNGGLLENVKPVAFLKVTAVFFRSFLLAEVVCSLK